jgi:hypothetical protein
MKPQMKTEPKERGILMSGPMVRATLEDRKTQTRRVKGLETINERPDAWRHDGVNIYGDHLFFNVHGVISGHDPQDCSHVVKCSYGKPGDRLWVRETHALVDTSFITPAFSDRVLYRADFEDGNPDTAFWSGKWTPGIHLFRKHSRITLEITNVRVERLQDISEEDAKAEGVNDEPVVSFHNELHSLSYRKGFKNLWDKINGKKHPWASNPWVFVIEFRRIER